MDDKTLTRLSAAIAAVGIISLVLVANFAEPKSIEVGMIDRGMIGQNVVVNGTAESVSIREGNIFIELANNGSKINVVLFEQDAQNTEGAYTIKEGDFIEVGGKVSLYRNSLEIIAASVSRAYSHPRK